MVNTLGEAKLNMKLNWATGTNWFYHAISLYTAPTEVVIKPINPLCLIIFWGTSRLESYIYIYNIYRSHFPIIFTIFCWFNSYLHAEAAVYSSNRSAAFAKLRCGLEICWGLHVGHMVPKKLWILLGKDGRLVDDT